MQTCQGDIHSGNAKILFPEEATLIDAEPKGRGKPFRDVAKNAGFGVTYLAETETVFQFLRSKGFDVHYRDVSVMMDRMHEAYADYFRYVARNVAFVAETGFMRSLLTGRIRWLGWHCPPTETANFPIQSMIADLMNERLPQIAAALPRGAAVVAQIHDAAIIETPEQHVDRVQQIIAGVWARPIIVPAAGRHGGSLKLEEGAREFVMPIEFKCKDRWSDL
jgi:DNA polymerase I-like protein with 3'-5' exonuclease and polymerase domains